MDHVWSEVHKLLELNASRADHVVDEDAADGMRCVRGGDECGQELAALRLSIVDGDGTFSLVQVRPEQAPTRGRQWPPPDVAAAGGGIDTDHIRAELSQVHPGRRGRHEGGGLHDTDPLQREASRWGTRRLSRVRDLRHVLAGAATGDPEVAFSRMSRAISMFCTCVVPS